MITLGDAGLWITTLLAVMTRVGAFVATAPLLGQNVIPARIKAGVVIAFSVALLPIAPHPAFDIEREPLRVVGGLVLEAGVGALFGLVARMMFDAVTFAAEALSMSMGLGSANLFDPMLGQQGSVLAVLQGQVALALFLTLDGHHLVLRVLGRSLDAVPMLAPHFGPGLAWGLVHVVTSIASAGLALAAPVLTLLLLFQTGLAVLTRAVPSLGSFASMGFLATVAVGLVLLGASQTHWLQSVARLIRVTELDLDAAFAALASP